MKKFFMVLGLFVVATSAVMAADNFKPKAFAFDRMYFGAGVSTNDLIDTQRVFGNSIDYDMAQGFQALVGYDLGMRAKGFKLLVEVGYHDSGEFKGKIKSTGQKFDFRNKGPWTAAVVSYEFVPRFDGLVRLGYQFEDDRGPMFGAGVGYRVIKNLSLRVEAVRRDETNSFQFNVLFHP
jgi:opacity protein-like surface antigen